MTRKVWQHDAGVGRLAEQAERVAHADETRIDRRIHVVDRERWVGEDSAGRPGGSRQHERHSHGIRRESARLHFLRQCMAGKRHCGGQHECDRLESAASHDGRCCSTVAAAG
jgi:hypothetical protein